MSRPSGILARMSALTTQSSAYGPGECEDAITDCEIFHAFAELADNARDVAAEDGGEGYGKALFCGAGAHLPVNRIDAGCPDGDEDLARAGPGVGKVFILQLRRRPVLMQDGSFHVAPLLVRCRRCGVVRELFGEDVPRTNRECLRTMRFRLSFLKAHDPSLKEHLLKRSRLIEREMSRPG
jgi:hypothetical protein